MKTQKSILLQKASVEGLPMKKAGAPSSESGEVVKFDVAGMPQLEVWLEDETVTLTRAT